MNFLWADVETFSETPIKDGTYKYAANAEVILFAYAVDEEPVKVWDLTDGSDMPEDLAEALDNPQVMTVWHNSMFDRNVLRNAMNIDLPVSRIHDTMVQALSHSLPGSLGVLCEVMGVPIDKAKDKAGKSLIHLFCKPRPANSKLRRATSKTHPTEWERFKEYAKLDVEAMRVVYRKLPKWNYAGIERKLWELDQKINDRGVAVDVELANAAIAAVEQEQAILAKRTKELTYHTVDSATQRDRLLNYICEAFDIDLPDMQASTLERRMNDPDLPPEARELFALRLQASTSSTSKYKTLIKSASVDDRIRGTLQFCGASRTGRWSGRTLQPQNLPRPTLKQHIIDEGIIALKAGGADLITDNVMELVSNTIRSCIVPSKNKKLIVSDLANIEGRVAAWLAGEEWKLEAFRQYDKFILDDKGNKIPDGKGDFLREGPDLYKVAYARAFDIDAGDVDKDQRQIGKVMELMLQYQGGVGAFLTGAMTYRIDLSQLADVAWSLIPKEIKETAHEYLKYRQRKKAGQYGLTDKAFVVCDSLKIMWRNAHPQITSYWDELENAAINAIHKDRTDFLCRKLIVRRDGAWLRVILPSGRSLCYPAPKLDGDKISYMGLNQYTRKWQRIYTYGGKFFENDCQSVARDVMAYNMFSIEDDGFDILLSVHDELITEAVDSKIYTADRLSKLIATNPKWAKGLPLAAGGFETYRYRKD